MFLSCEKFAEQFSVDDESPATNNNNNDENISNITITNVTSSTANGSYNNPDVISIQVTFSNKVYTNTTGGLPYITLETGSSDGLAYLNSGYGTTSLTFLYTVVDGHNSTDLNYHSTSALTVPTGSFIRSAFPNGQNIDVTLPALSAAESLATNKAIIIDTLEPTINSIDAVSANGIYIINDTVTLKVNFAEVVYVIGTPQLSLETGSTNQIANYSSGSGTNSLNFTYTVQSGDVAADLDYTTTTALSLNGGTIRDLAGNNATLTLPAPAAANSLSNLQNIEIDGIAPTVTLVSSSAADAAYKIGDGVPIIVTFDDSVTVTGTPRLLLETGSSDQNINYSSGTTTTALTFNYTVQSGDESTDLDYQSTTALTLNGGSIQDVNGNDAVLTLVTPGNANSLSDSNNLVIDGIVPYVTSVTASNANGTYGTAQVINIQIQFNENVTVTNTPQLGLETGVVDQAVDYNSGSTTSTLVFPYTVLAGHETADLDYRTNSSLILNGGMIKDAAGNDATLTLAAPGAVNSLGNNKAIVIRGASMFVILNPSDTTTDSCATVTVNAQSPSGVIDPHYSTDVTLVADGNATGEGIVNINLGTGSLSLCNATAETVNLSLTDSQATGLAVTSTQNIIFSPGALSSMVYTTAPLANQTLGNNFQTQPVVTLYDANNNILTNNSTANVTLTAFTDALCITAAGGTLNSNTATAVNGVATFAGLDYSLAATIYLKATVNAITQCSNATTVYHTLALSTGSLILNTLDTATITITGGVPALTCDGFNQNQSGASITSSCYVCGANSCIDYSAGKQGGGNVDILSVSDNAVATNNQILSFTINGPKLLKTNGNENFGVINNGTVSYTIGNQGNASANNLNVAIGGADSARFSIGATDTCSAQTISALASCVVAIDYTDGGAGSGTIHSATLTITGSNGGETVLNLTAEVP